METTAATAKSPVISISAIIIGGLALVLALAHFWSAPQTPKPAPQSNLASLSSSVHQSVLSLLQGKSAETNSQPNPLHPDRVAVMITTLLGTFALILAALATVRREPATATGCAALLGLAAIALPYFTLYIMVALVIIFIVAVIIALGDALQG
ncbi:MAG: hypothetical protein LAT63_01070 [Marinobacter sp.]|nr:hypothetical protein [Marinobacter sp.]